MKGLGKLAVSDRPTPFETMTATGQRLIEAQQREETIGQRCSKHRTGAQLEEWKGARREVERLAQEYLLAVRAWRESIEDSVTEALANGRFWRLFPGVLRRK